MPDPALLDLPATVPPTAPDGPLADLILARLLAAQKSVSFTDIAKAVGEFYERPPSAAQLAEVVAGLKTSGLMVTAKGQQLTDDGRTRALAYLGLAELPARTGWPAIRAKYLLNKSLGLKPTEDAKSLRNDDTLAAIIIKRKFDLPSGTADSTKAAFESLVCKFLGFPDHISFATVIPAVINRELNFDPPFTPETLTASGAVSVLGAPPKRYRIDRLRAVALRNLTANENLHPKHTSPPVRDPEPFDLESFANTVLKVARTSPTGRFGDNKVFISHVWRQVEDETRFTPLGLTGFKEKLVEANRENRLTLSRADLVQVMDAADVRESETAYLNAVFHFILLEKP